MRVFRAVASILLCACAGLDRQGPADAIVTASQDSVTLSLDVATQLTALRHDAAGHPLPGTLQWRSANRAIVVVDSTGTATAVGPGRTFIEVSDDVHTDSIRVTAVARYARVSAGQDVTCALTITGRALCWGSNTFGAVGNGSSDARSIPTVVDVNDRFTSIAVGSASVCATGDHLYCWGYNGVGQLGDGTITERDTPERIADSLRVARLTMGAGTTTCAFRQGVELPLAVDASPLLCWGWNGYGQLLDGGGVNSHRPKLLDAGRPLYAAAPGGHHVCALDANGAALCWGRNDNGQLGDGTFTLRLQPTPVAGNYLFQDLVAGVAHTCGRTLASEVFCWGDNTKGQLGRSGSASFVPVAVASGFFFQSLSSSSSHACGVTNHVAWCWGDNSAGQLGTGAVQTGGIPAPVSGAARFASVSAGLRHTCGITMDSEIYCWGDNSSGQLGDGTTDSHSVPVKVALQP